MPLNQNEAMDLAKQVLAVAKSVGAYLDAHWDELPENERDDLRAQKEQLLVAAMSLSTDAVGLALEDAQTSLAELKGLTQKAEDTLDTIGDVRKGFQIAAAVIGLGAAVVSRDIGGIAENAKAVHDAVTA